MKKQELKDSLKLIMLKRTSKKKAILQEDLANKLEITKRQARTLIHEVRAENPFGCYYLVSDHKVGFWLSNNQKDIEKWVKGYLGKALSILPVVKKAKKLCSHKFSEEIGTLFSLKDDIELQKKFAHAIKPSGEKTGKQKL